MGIIQVRATSILQFFPFFNSDSEDFSRKMANWAKHLAAGSECPVFAKDKLTFLNMILMHNKLNWFLMLRKFHKSLIKFPKSCFGFTPSINHLLFARNAAAWLTMESSSNDESTPRAMEKIKILGAVFMQPAK